MELYAIQKQKKFGCAPNPFENGGKIAKICVRTLIHTSAAFSIIAISFAKLST